MVRKTSIPETVSGEELAALLNVDVRTIRNLAAAGTITRTDRNTYPLAESVRGVVAAAKKSSRSSALDREQAAILAGKRRMLEMRLAQEEGKLIELDEAFAVLDLVIATFRIGLDRLPARITRDVTLRKQIKAECDNTMAEASKKFQDFAHNPPTTNTATKENIDND